MRDGVLVTGPETCFASEALANRSVGGLASYSMAAAAMPSAVMLASNAVGKHYTSTGYSGSSITIVGTQCLGGVWKPSGSWNNNIESSRHYCGGRPTTFYDSSTCSGGSYGIYSDVTSLGWVNNLVSCVRYG